MFMYCYLYNHDHLYWWDIWVSVNFRSNSMGIENKHYDHCEHVIELGNGGKMVEMHENLAEKMTSELTEN